MSLFTRVAPLLALGALAGGVVYFDQELSPPAPVAYGSVTVPPMPIVPLGAPLSSSWFCPGVPAPADPAAGNGFVSVLNAGDTPIEGAITVYSTEGQPVTAPLVVEERSRADVRLGDLTTSPWAAAVVELLGAGGVVEQSAIGPTGRSTTACANSAGSTWYLADGATTLEASLGILLFNPFPDDAIVDVAFSTSEGTRKPQATQGYVVPASSVRLLELNEIVRREPTVATTVEARSGRVVAGRVQTYQEGARRALSVGLASPAPAEQWWFASGQKSDTEAERITIFNPGESDAEVDVAFYPADPSAAPPNDPVQVTVPAGASASVDLSETDTVPTGQHSILVVTEQSRPVVAERVMEVQGDVARNVTIQAGSPLSATTWTFVTGAPDGAEAMVIANATGLETTVDVLALGPAGFTVVPGLEDLPLPAAGLVRIDLDERGLAGVPLVVEGAQEVVAERLVGAPVGQPGISISRGIPYLG
jgi:hypothetical protein